MNLIETIKAYFGNKKVAPAAAYNVFSAASDACDAAFDAIDDYTTRANHRYTILNAKRELNKAHASDHSATNAYDKKVAAFAEPVDFEPYTENYLAAHTAAVDALSSAFDNLTAAFTALDPADHLYAAAARLYIASRNLYEFAAKGYSNAAYCAMTTALEGQLQAAKDEFEVRLVEARASSPTENNPVAAKAKAAAFKAKATANAVKAGLLQQKARIAEAKAEALLAKLRADPNTS